MSAFKDVPLLPPNEILGLAAQTDLDKHEYKVDLTIGAYRDDKGKPVVLPAVRAAEEIIYNSKLGHEYLPQDGLPEFTAMTQALMFGDDHRILKEKRVHSCQSISGTGALRLAMDFFKANFPSDVTVFIPSVTWGNHSGMLKSAGVKQGIYTYLDEAGTGLNFPGMLHDIEACPENSIILLHAIAHNPTGVDPTEEEWNQLRTVMQSRNHLAFFDNAYQGFVTGDPSIDAYAVRSFADAGMEMVVACSFSKNFALYGERAGVVHTVVKDSALCEPVASHMRALSRVVYSTCPTFGARVVAIVLSTQEIKEQWLKDVDFMAKRLDSVRRILHSRLNELNVKGTWEHVIKQRGMFTFTGLTKEKVLQLREKHIYMLNNGRVSLAGLNTGNIEYFCQSLLSIIGTN